MNIMTSPDNTDKRIVRGVLKPERNTTYTHPGKKGEKTNEIFNREELKTHCITINIRINITIEFGVATNEGHQKHSNKNERKGDGKDPIYLFQPLHFGPQGPNIR